MSDCSATVMRKTAVPVSTFRPSASAFICQLQVPVPWPSIESPLSP
jgi:hypothetical protein